MFAMQFVEKVEINMLEAKIIPYVKLDNGEFGASNLYDVLKYNKMRLLLNVLPIELLDRAARTTCDMFDHLDLREIDVFNLLNQQ